jgi:AcrR family transcriptional regulator
MPKLDRDQIVEAALGLMDEHGIEWLTMRRLAGALGVSAPTLYWHLPDKDALHDACVDRALREIEIPVADHDDWRAGIRVFMASMRSQLGRHPSATQLMTRSHPAAVARIASGAISLMRASGMAWDDAFLYCRLMIWRVVGFTGMEHTLRTASELHRPETKRGRAVSPARFRLTVAWPDELPSDARDASTLVDLDLMFSTDVEMFIAGVDRVVAARTDGPG